MLGVNAGTLAVARLSLVDLSYFEISLLHIGAVYRGDDTYSLFKIDTIKSTSKRTLVSILQLSLLNAVGFDSFKKAWDPPKEVWKASRKEDGFKGLAQAGVMNLTYIFRGFVQAGAAFSYTGTFLGLMQTGFINSAGYGSIGSSLVMTQEEELPNETVTDKKTKKVTELGQAREGFKGGFQVGVWNTATRFAGIGQIGLLNMAQTMKGTQTGVVNVARTVYGAQIGLVNYTGDLYGFQIGLVNIVRNNKVFFMPFLMASF